MRPDPTESVQDAAAGRADERDSPRILDLIEQLDRDLIETKKNASRRG